MNVFLVALQKDQSDATTMLRDARTTLSGQRVKPLLGQRGSKLKTESLVAYSLTIHTTNLSMIIWSTVAI